MELLALLTFPRCPTYSLQVRQDQGNQLQLTVLSLAFWWKQDQTRSSLWWWIQRWLSYRFIMTFLISWSQLWPIHARPARLCKRLWMRWKTVMNSSLRLVYEISLVTMPRSRNSMSSLSTNKYHCLWLLSLWMSWQTSWWWLARK